MPRVQVGVGDIVDGRYRVVRVVGRGGMGLVVAARHMRLSHEVAIKFPFSTLGAPADVVERLLREARAAMQLRSEHVARVHDMGFQDGIGPYLVMEYLIGRDLGKVLAQSGPLPTATAVEYVLQACEALAEAHSRRIIHRDIKPSNLFLTERADGTPLVKIIDFGLAKCTDAELQVALTVSREPLGSPLFMAPEQMRGAANVDPRADIWALGATLYTLLTAAPPFPGANLLDVYDRIARGAPRLRDQQPSAPLALDETLLRCLSVTPGDRYANVADFADGLANVDADRFRPCAERVRRILDQAIRSIGSADRGGVVPTPEYEANAPTSAEDWATEPPRDASWADSPHASRPESLAVAAPPSLATRTHRIAVAVATLVLALGTAGAVKWAIPNAHPPLSRVGDRGVSVVVTRVNSEPPITPQPSAMRAGAVQPKLASPAEPLLGTRIGSARRLSRESATPSSVKPARGFFAEAPAVVTSAPARPDPLADPD